MSDDPERDPVEAYPEGHIRPPVAEVLEAAFGEEWGERSCATTYTTWGCPEHEVGHASCEYCPGKHCPRNKRRDAYQDRARPLIETFEQLGAAMDGAGKVPGMGVAMIEATTPPELWGRIGFENASELRKLGHQLIEDLWSRRAYPGKPTTNIQVHLTSSSTPHERKPHLHVMIPGVGRAEVPPGEPSPAGKRYRRVGKRRRREVDARRAKDQGLWDHEDDRVEYAKLRGPRGDVPSELHLTTDDLDWLGRRWAQLLGHAFGIRRRRLVVHYAYAHRRHVREVADENGRKSRRDGDREIHHQCRYNTRAFLQDVESQIEEADHEQVLYKPTGPDDAVGDRLFALQDVVGGLRWREWDQPRGWKQGAWYGWMAATLRRRTFTELGLEYECAKELKKRLREEAKEDRCCSVCGQDYVKLAAGLTFSEARASLDRPPPRAEDEIVAIRDSAAVASAIVQRSLEAHP